MQLVGAECRGFVSIVQPQGNGVPFAPRVAYEAVINTGYALLTDGAFYYSRRVAEAVAQAMVDGKTLQLRVHSDYVLTSA